VTARPLKFFCLGGAGQICREAVLDLVQFSGASRITVADIDVEAGKRVVAWLKDPRVDFLEVDVRERRRTVAKMRGYDVVLDGTTIALNGLSTACIGEAGCHGINLNGFGQEHASAELFQKRGRTCVPGFGMTPGITQMMAMHAAQQLDTVETVRVSHGAFRPIAFSPSILETTTYEYNPTLSDRVVFEEGQFLQVPPFARPREVVLPEPYGQTVQYIIPHAETRTLAQALKSKGVKLIEVRGAWPEPNMQLLRVLYDWGFLRNTPVSVNGARFGILEAIGAYLRKCPAGRETALYGYALHVEVAGAVRGQRRLHVLTHTHPPSDGSVRGWERLRAYTRNVGIPLSIGAQLLATGQVQGTGVIIPEDAFKPEPVFAELRRRKLTIHETIAEAPVG
jgi:saccharopine dehydrogenase-like NADP-dependent oxidoreductase